MSATRYTATATREGRWWIVAIPALDGLTQSRRLAGIQRAAREYIAATLDVPVNQVDRDMTVSVDDQGLTR